MQSEQLHPEYLIASAPGFVSSQLDLTTAHDAEALLLRLISGTARVSGSVLDAAGGALVGARIQATSLVTPGALGFASSDAAGSFSLVMPAGAVQLQATLDAYSSSQTILDAPADGARLVLEPAAVIEGQVVAGSGAQALAGAQVTATRANGGGGPPRVVAVSPEGRFLFPALAPGSYELVAAADQGRSSPSVVGVGLGETATVELQLHAATTMQGFIRLDGEACPRGGLELAGPVWLSAEVRSQGAFSLSGVLPGQYAATVRCDGAAPLRETVIVQQLPVQRDFELLPGLSVSGTVQGHDGRPVAGANVLVQPLSRTQPSGSADAPLQAGASCTSDEAGGFACTGLAPGPYEIGAWLGGYSSSPLTPLALATDDVADLLLRVRAFGTIRVTTPRGALPASSLSVVARGPRGYRQARRSSDEFIFDQLELGAYSVFVGHASEVPRDARRVELVRDGQVEELSLPVPEARSIAGTVLDGDLSPVADARVEVNGSDFSLGDEAQTTVLTDPQGAFVIPSLLPGPYDLSVSSEAGEATMAAVPAGSQNVRVRLKRFGSIAGTVRDGRGAPLATFTVSYTDAAGQTRSVRGADGEWSLPRLLEGPYQLAVSTPEAGSSQASVHVNAGAAVTLALVLSQHEPEQAPAQLAEGAPAARPDALESAAADSSLTVLR